MFGGGALVYGRAHPGWRARLRQARRRALDVLDPGMVISLIAVIAKYADPDDDRLVGELEAERTDGAPPNGDTPNGES